ncbi:hypothetical protein JCM10207_001769 [Rhodosporidiobolus poonsookiae]
MSTVDVCHARHSPSQLGLQIGALWVILVTSLAGTLFPVIAKRVPALRRTVPASIFEFAKSFGSGIILATACVHLLEPAVNKLGASNKCRGAGWDDYPYAYGLALVTVYLAFVGQIMTTRYGSSKLEHLTAVNADPETNCVHSSSPTSSTTDNEKALSRSPSEDKEREVAFHDATEENTLAAQLIAVFTLEFGVCFHSVIIGITLAVTDNSGFKPLFVVLIFHQMFEGLGVGTRLAFLKMSSKYSWVPWVGSLAYSVCTPVGMAVGLGIHQGLAVKGSFLTVTAGVMYALSAGILLYTAMIELMAHEIVFSKYYQNCSIGRLSFTLISFALGAGFMALLGKWASRAAPIARSKLSPLPTFQPLSHLSSPMEQAATPTVELCTAFPTLDAFLDAVQAEGTAPSASSSASTSAPNDVQLEVRRFKAGKGATVKCKLGKRKPGRKKVGERRKKDDELCPFTVTAKLNGSEPPSFVVTAATPHSAYAHSLAGSSELGTTGASEGDAAVEADKEDNAQKQPPPRPQPRDSAGHFMSSSTVSEGGEHVDNPAASAPPQPDKFVLPLLAPPGTRNVRHQKKRRPQSQRAHEGDASWDAWRVLLGEMDDEVEQEQAKDGARAKRRKVEVDIGAVKRMGGRGALRAWEWWDGESSPEGVEVEAPAWEQPALESRQRHEHERAGDEDVRMSPPPLCAPLGSSSTPEPQEKDSDYDPEPEVERVQVRGRGKGRGGRSRSRSGGGRRRSVRAPSTPAMSTRRTARCGDGDRMAVDEEDARAGEDGDGMTFLNSAEERSPASYASPLLARPNIIHFPPWSTPPGWTGTPAHLVSPFPHSPDCPLNVSASPSLKQNPVTSYTATGASQTPISAAQAFFPTSASPQSPVSSFILSPSFSFSALSATPATSYTSSFAYTPSPRVSTSPEVPVAFSSPAPSASYSQPPPPTASSPRFTAHPASTSPKISKQPLLPAVIEDEQEANEGSTSAAMATEQEEDALEALLSLGSRKTVPVEEGLEQPVTASRSVCEGSPAPALFSAAVPPSPPGTDKAASASLAFRPRQRVSFTLASAGVRRKSSSSATASSSSASSTAEAVALASAQAARAQEGQDVSQGGQTQEASEDEIRQLKERLWGKGGDQEGTPLDSLYTPTLLTNKLASLSADHSFTVPPALGASHSSRYTALLISLPKPSRARLPLPTAFPTVLTPAALLAQFRDARTQLALEYLYGRRLSDGECAYLEKRERALWGLVRVMAAVAEVNERCSEKGGHSTRAWLRRG